MKRGRTRVYRRVNGRFSPMPKIERQKCAAEGCNRLEDTAFYCRGHYRRVLVHGSPMVHIELACRKEMSMEEKLRRRTYPEPNTGCWIWAGGDNGRYGTLNIGNHKMQPAHRATYELAKGKIPDGLHIDHLCRNTFCVNPDHLEAVTCKENVMRGEGLASINAKKTHCPKGHPYSGDNLYLHPNGSRKCVTCRRYKKRGNNETT